jgi:hypothetical protein
METDQRQSPRKLLKVSARLTVQGAGTIECRTLDVGPGGLSLSAPRNFPAGQRCTVGFVLPLKHGRQHPVTCLAQVAYGVISRADGFKLGLKFLDVDSATAAALAEYTKP